MKSRERPKTLHEALAERGSLTRLARKLGVHISYLSDIRHGRRTPPLALALAIQRETGVPIESLLSAEAA